MDGVIAEILISVPAQSIAGGTDEIQRNIWEKRLSACLANHPSTETGHLATSLIAMVEEATHCTGFGRLTSQNHMNATSNDE